MQILRVLLIEDEPSDANYIRVLIEGQKDGSIRIEQIDHAIKLADAKKLIFTNTYDIIILDLSLPDATGFDTFKEVTLIAPSLPIIILSGLRDDAIASRCVTMGAQDYIVKDDLSEALIIRSIKYAVERSDYRKEIQSLASFTELSPIPMMRLNPLGKIEYANEASRFILESWSLRLGEDSLPDSLHKKAMESYEDLSPIKVEEFISGSLYEFYFSPRESGKNINLYVRSILESTSTKPENDTIHKHIIESSINGVCACSSNGKIIVFNHAMEALSGIKREDAIGKKPDEIPFFEDKEKVLKAFSNASTGLATENIEGEYRPIGEIHPINLSATFMPLKKKSSILGAVSLWRENTPYSQVGFWNRFRVFLEMVNDAVFILDAKKAVILDANKRAENLLGMPLSHFIGRHYTAIHPESQKKRYEELFEASVKNDLGECLVKMTVERADGKLIQVETNSGLANIDGREVLVSVYRDITERIRFEEALHHEKERAMVILQSITDAVITTDVYGIITYLNPMAESVGGIPNDKAKGLPVEEVFNFADDRTGEKVGNAAGKVLREGRIVQAGKLTVSGRGGREYSMEESAAPLKDSKGNIIGVTIVLHDVSQTRKLFDQMQYHASHDFLTGLYNRKMFEKYLTESLENSKKTNTTHAVLYFDFDMFKIINDAGGHIAGDTLLRELSAHLKDIFSSAKAFARVGSDEFCVLIENCSLREAQVIAEEARRSAYNYRFEWNTREFPVRISVGIVGLNSETESVASILSHADEACYTAKSNGGNRIHVYVKGDTALSKRRTEMQWVAKIRKAFDSGKFKLYHQKISPIDNRLKISEHSEILIRMLDDNGSIISPGMFMPAAERYNLMPAIDRFVVRETFVAYEKRQMRSEEPINLEFSINLSGASINDSKFLDYIFEQFVQFDVPPKAITFEVTESVAIENINRATDFIRELKRFGCRFSLDDFGSGLSSFHYLKSLPVDYLKIDGSFVLDIIDEPLNFAMVHSMNHIGHIMGMRTIAEFVENESVLKKIAEIGVDYAQGYGVGMPIPLE